MDALTEYTTRREKWRAEEESRNKRFILAGNWRLTTGAATVLLTWLIFGPHFVPPATLLAPLGAFIYLAFMNQRITRGQTAARRAITFYDSGLARLTDQWAGKGNAGERFRDPAHIYSDDLDLFGKGSLFELVARTRTAAGEDLLASWLLQPCDREEALARQEATVELRPNLALREDIALLAEDVRAEVNAVSLRAWGLAPIIHFPRLLPLLCAVLAICGVSAVIGFFAQVLPLWPAIAILGIDFGLLFLFREKTRRTLESVEGSARDLTILSLLVERLEREQFVTARLQQLRAALNIEGASASKRIAKLGRLFDWLDSGDHIFVRAVRPLVLWQIQLAYRFEEWRRQSGQYIGQWIAAVAEFEALSSFASLSFERPDWCFPNPLATPLPQFEALALKHPLIAQSECVPNDVSLGIDRKLMIVSGSNMSGKSTLLRAVGLNAVLAWAGAPVAASSLQLSALETATSIRVNDSLQDHRSRFYSEITRLRQIVDLAQRGKAVLFLLDELLSGTNSHDRRIGAAGIIRALLRTNAIGLMTTHDLALANLEQDVTSGAVNVHFEDRMNGAEMIFDYKLKAGVVTRSNAIELMRAVGLDV